MVISIIVIFITMFNMKEVEKDNITMLVESLRSFQGEGNPERLSEGGGGSISAEKEQGQSSRRGNKSTFCEPTEAVGRLGGKWEHWALRAGG